MLKLERLAFLDQMADKEKEAIEEGDIVTVHRVASKMVNMGRTRLSGRAWRLVNDKLKPTALAERHAFRAHFGAQFGRQ